MPGEMGLIYPDYISFLELAAIRIKQFFDLR